MNGEFWYGWFDHWGEKHHTTPAARGAANVDWMLSRGISVNLYMAHGGSTFGYMAGANADRAYQPDISAYDYDAPIDEAGRPNAKFTAMRDVLRKYLAPGERLPDLPAALPMIAIPKFELTLSAPPARLPKAAHTGPLKTIEELGQGYGFMLYRHYPTRAAKGTLEIGEIRDFAVVRGTYLDRRLHQNKVDVELVPGQPLDILVEAMGRVNFGPQLVSDRKGISGKITLNGEEVPEWEHYSIPLTDPANCPFAGMHRGAFHLDSAGDTFLDLRGWGKGLVWINGHNLGRYWRIGPQQSLFVPAPWLKQGANEAIVLDLMEARTRTLESHTDPIYETPA
jgi:beta-galactosidase